MRSKKAKNVKGKFITIHDIAREAGVSASTVSRVINGFAAITDEKRQAVLSTMEQMNYRPSVVAQGLARGKSATVGVLTQNIMSLFYGEILLGIEHRLKDTAYDPIIADGKWQIDVELKALDLLMARRVDVIIILGGHLADEYIRTVAEKIPLIVVGRIVKGLEDHSLDVDNFQGAYTATRHLIELGHKHIVHVAGILTHPDAINRHNGYCQALLDAGLPIDQNLIAQGNFWEQSGVLAIENLLNRGRHFTAVFSANDQMAYGVRLALFRRGISVPGDISLIGFDNQPGSAYSAPPLTTINYPTFEIGIAATDAVLRMIDGGAPQLPHFSTELLIRESTALCRSEHSNSFAGEIMTG